MGDVYQLTNACEPNTYRLSNTLFYTLPQNALIARHLHRRKFVLAIWNSYLTLQMKRAL